jgi:hypothetical protein
MQFGKKNYDLSDSSNKKNILHKPHVTKIFFNNFGFPQCEQIFRWAETGLRLANLANRLAFLFKGQYPSIPERVLDIPPIPASDQHNRNIGYSYMTRELLWHSLIVSIFFKSMYQGQI